jgi:hypothetical protein
LGLLKVWFILFFFFETGSNSVAQDDLELMILLLQPPQCCNYRCAPPCVLHHIFFNWTSDIMSKTIRTEVCGIDALNGHASPRLLVQGIKSGELGGKLTLDFVFVLVTFRAAWASHVTLSSGHTGCFQKVFLGVSVLPSPSGFLVFLCLKGNFPMLLSVPLPVPKQ